MTKFTAQEFDAVDEEILEGTKGWDSLALMQKARTLILEARAQNKRHCRGCYCHCYLDASRELEDE